MRFTERIHAGRTVVAAGGESLGTVEGLVIDSESWKVEALQLKLASETADRVGAYWNYFHAGRLEVPTRLVSSVSDSVLLSASVDELGRLQAGESPAASPP
ncbi:PRC-barrel domain containing protein [Aggregicoccus sp. 17bor-14]|uniref:PRC-barrel domain-containing protein n=1 Tax=Myxococcaceae TaxID=31 RepID=UPI00129C5B95|nr:MULTISPECIES: PRC-barrel domain-containing protein [Myxococcaceae]MBF5045470.1 PRC-barrel domain-containing protein [Simulacricoccus sp. 17bor-14]MRI91208.1 PRC-barrel domain containing protein [Aggregicoccus sp. 17bor-14]